MPRNPQQFNPDEFANKKEEPTKADQADALLAAEDTFGMTTEEAEQVLADPDADQETKECAEGLRSEADESGLNEDKAGRALTEGDQEF
jgi:hypothetical protein